MSNLDSILKSRDITLPTKGPSSQGYGFSCGHVWMWELDCEEGWSPKNWCFWTVVLEKTLESPLDSKEIQPVHAEGDQPWDFFGRNDAKAETPVLWPPYVKSWLIGKDPDAGRDWGQEEKETTEDEMAGWDHWLDKRESEWTPGVGDGQGGLACCDSRGHKELDMTERLNWTELVSNWYFFSSPAMRSMYQMKCMLLGTGGGGLVTKSCPTLATPCTAALPSSSVHGILQARILEWIAIADFNLWNMYRSSLQLRW